MELEVEHQFFKRILPELQKEHMGEHVLIKGEKVIAFYDNRDDAVREGFKQFPHQAIYVKQILDKYEPIKFFSIF